MPDILKINFKLANRFLVLMMLERQKKLAYKKWLHASLQIILLGNEK